ncbi:MAG: FIST signal transduction protein [Treponema socranskii subsp. buccale]
MKQEVVSTAITGDIHEVVNSLCRALQAPFSAYSAVIFFASSIYDFSALSAEIKARFPDAEVIGTTTCGEISMKGFTNHSIVLTAVSGPEIRFSGVLLDAVNKFPIIHKKKILSAMNRCGIDANDPACHMHAFALAFVNGICQAEEALLSVFYAVVPNDKFIIAGGGAGDDLQFKKNYVSYNGDVISDGAVILFFHTSLKFDIRKENIYKPNGKQVTVTQADVACRLIRTMNYSSPRKEYAEAVGCPESGVGDMTFDHPLGRRIGDEIFITAFDKFNPDGTVNMQGRILPGSIIDILEPDDYAEITRNTCDEIIRAIPHPQFVMFINCAFRALLFARDKSGPVMTSIYNAKFPVYCGFSSYGELFRKVYLNQTLVSIVIGE